MCYIIVELKRAREKEEKQLKVSSEKVIPIEL